MKTFALTLALAAISLTALPSQAANVGVSISINQPGLFGRIDLGDMPPPPAPVLIYPQPVVMVPSPVAVQQRPIYLHVPPDHYRDWRRHCGHYNACGQPVYFVRDDWGNHYDRQERRWRDERRDNWRDDHRNDRRDDRRDGWRDDHGHGHGHGRD